MFSGELCTTAAVLRESTLTTAASHRARVEDNNAVVEAPSTARLRLLAALGQPRACDVRLGTTLDGTAWSLGTPPWLASCWS